MCAVVLCVAEKPSIAETISEMLSRAEGSTVRFRKAIGTPVHEFEYSWKGSKALFRVTSVTGHVYSTDFPKEFQSWDSVNPSELFAAPIVKVPTSTSTCRHLQHEAKTVDAVILWLDCDREGENICFEVLQNMQHLKGEQIFRAKFSSITQSDITGAMKRLGKPNLNESLAVDARQEIDLKVGVAFSRFQTRFFLDKYGNLNSKLISYGPCQTPTLCFCVQRHDEIQTFVAEDYWKLSLTLKRYARAGLREIPLLLNWCRGRTFEKKIGQMFFDICKGETHAKVISVKEKTKSQARPVPLNTVTLLKAASSGLGLGPQITMKIAEHLYLRGYISYPRTETTSFPDEFDYNSVLQELSTNSQFGYFASALSRQKIANPKKGIDAGDHPPITPMRNAEEGRDLSADEWRVFDFIARYFLGCISVDAKVKHTNVEVQVGPETFSVSGQILQDKGFLEVMPWLKSGDLNLPEMKEEDKIEIDSIVLKECKTEPPGYLSESELIGLMEKYGIGTDASISTHIANIIERNYVKIGSGRTLVPNDLGVVLVHGYMKIDPELALPSLRSYIEKQVTLIAKGQASKSHVTSYALDIFQRKFEYFQANIERMNLLFESHFCSVESTQGKLLSRCGKCRRMMKYIALKPARLYCSNCEETYKLPQNGKISLYMEKKCPFDDFEILRFSTASGSSGLSYFVCPYCYNYPPFENITQGMACNTCSHPTCPQSLNQNIVCGCQQESCDGDLVFDPSSGPLWKFSCNKCNSVLLVAEKAHNVVALKTFCDDCGSREFEVDFHKEFAASRGIPKLEGCFFCDDVLNSTSKALFGKRSKFSGRGRRGGRRGGRRKRQQK